ncbi:hypothetical protein HanIR_Chr10g0463941 [Helianthus annuus]|nr:hypothetical protein HanIR_Chr10g0463941 [Helianthus annuus]
MEPEMTATFRRIPVLSDASRHFQTHPGTRHGHLGWVTDAWDESATHEMSHGRMGSWDESRTHGMSHGRMG